MLAVACRDPAAPARSPSGVYVLRTVEDRALPYSFFIGSGTSDVIQADTTTLYPDGTFRHVEVVETRYSGGYAPRAWVGRGCGRWSQTGAALALTSNGSPWRHMTVARDGKTLEQSVAARGDVPRMWRWTRAGEAQGTASADTIRVVAPSGRDTLVSCGGAW